MTDRISALPPCPLLYEDPAPGWGWDHLPLFHPSQEHPVALHVLPAGDDRLHQLDEECWCCPTYEVTPDGPDVLIHNSADGREAYERGERKPH